MARRILRPVGILYENWAEDFGRMCEFKMKKNGTKRDRNRSRGRPPAYLSSETLASELDCSKSTVDEYEKKLILPKPYKIGSMVRFRWSEVDTKIVADNNENLRCQNSEIADEILISEGIERVNKESNGDDS